MNENIPNIDQNLGIKTPLSEKKQSANKGAAAKNRLNRIK
jgi:hypothetical protein